MSDQAKCRSCGKPVLFRRVQGYPQPVVLDLSAPVFLHENDHGDSEPEKGRTFWLKDEPTDGMRYALVGHGAVCKGRKG